jgi:hypothetical protein
MCPLLGNMSLQGGTYRGFELKFGAKIRAHHTKKSHTKKPRPVLELDTCSTRSFLCPVQRILRTDSSFGGFIASCSFRTSRKTGLDANCSVWDKWLYVHVNFIVYE